MAGVDITRDAANELLSYADLVQGRDDAAEQAVQRVEALALEDAGDTPEDRAEYLWLIEQALAADADRIKRARKAVETARLRDVAEHGAIRLGDSAYRAAPDAGWEIDDVDSLVAYLDQARPGAIADVFRLSSDNLRITALKAVAADLHASRYPDDDDDEIRAYVQTVVDTFVHRALRGDGGWKLDTVYPGRTKWAQRLDHRERDPKRRPDDWTPPDAED